MTALLTNRLVTRIVLRLYALYLERIALSSFLAALDDPARAQAAVLDDIVRSGEDTQFGRDHGFESITDAATYRSQVDVQTYGSLKPHVESQRDTGARALTAAPPEYYARTSGTTGAYKDIPLTGDGVRQVRFGRQVLTYSVLRDTDFLAGDILGFAGRPSEGMTSRGVPFGPVSGVTYESVSYLLDAKLIIPSEAFEIHDYDERYWIYGLCGLASTNVTGIAAANPSTLVRVIEVIDEHGDELLDVLITGKIDRPLSDTGRAVVAAVRSRYLDNVDRWKAWRRNPDPLTPSTYWAAASGVTTWMGGSCGIPIAYLREALPSTVRFVEYGYAASEFIGTVNVDASTNRCVPLVTEHFYEFVHRDDYENSDDTAQRTLRFVDLGQLVEGEEYYIFVTTRSGLYRYDINDIVVAGPSVGATPTLSFVQKGRGVTNITGEKLTESHLLRVVPPLLDTAGIGSSFFILLADEHAARYDLLIEAPEWSGIDTPALAASIDAEFCAANSEYDAKRGSGRLAELRVVPRPAGTGERLKLEAVERGIRESQYKPTVLGYRRDYESLYE